MSHSHKDAVGGHVGSWITSKAGIAESGMMGRRFTKRWNRREARREAHQIVSAGLQDLEDARLAALAAEQEAFEYELAYEQQFWEDDMFEQDDEWERQQDEYEADIFESYYDGYDLYGNYSYFEMVREQEDVNVPAEMLEQPIYSEGESLGEILERALGRR